MRRKVARRRWLVAFGVLVAAALASELFLPRYLEGRIEHRLTETGGWARVSLDGEPALRLLMSHGHRVEVAGGEMRLDLRPAGSGRGTALFEKLDGFEEVLLRLRHFRAGPLKARRLVLARASSDALYRFQVSATASPAALARYAASRLWAPADALGRLFTGPSVDEHIPIRFDLRVSSDDGRIHVVSARGAVAGIATGPLGEAVLGAVLRRL